MLKAKLSEIKFLKSKIVFLFVIVLCCSHLMYGSSQTSKVHYMFQSYYMPLFLYSWMLPGERYSNGTLIAWTITTNNELPVKENYSGTWTTWYQNGNKYFMGNFVNGKMNGKAEHWHENGIKEYAVNCVDGKRIGDSISWNENGNKHFVTNWVDGKEHGVTTGWYDDGSKYAETNYINGNLTGKVETWYYNGDRRFSGNYLNNKSIGKHEEWYFDGKKRSIYNYVDGKRDGLQQRWYQNGQLEFKKDWHNKKLISTEYWMKNGDEIKTKDYYSKTGKFLRRKLFYQGKHIGTELSQ